MFGKNTGMIEKLRDDRGLMTGGKHRQPRPDYVRVPDPPVRASTPPTGFITVRYNHTKLRFQVQRLPDVKMHERWRVTGRNGSLLLSNNRPVLARRELKSFPLTWKIEGPQINSRTFLDDLKQAMQDYSGKWADTKKP